MPSAVPGLDVIGLDVAGVVAWLEDELDEVGTDVVAMLVLVEGSVLDDEVLTGDELHAAANAPVTPRATNVVIVDRIGRT